MNKNSKFFPGEKVKLVSKEVLVKAGYPINNDPKDFLNSLAGKEVTIKNTFDEDFIYTCAEEPDVAIYSVFIECSLEYEMTQLAISKLLGITRNTVRSTTEKAMNKIKEMIEDKGIGQYV